MAGLKAIRSRLKTVKNTKKITYSMKLVSAAKLRKAQDAVTRSREYTNSLFRVLTAIKRVQRSSSSNSELSHPLMEKREVKNIKVIVIGGSRGLAGGYNANIGRKIDLLFKELSAQYSGANISSIVIGKKAGDHYKRVNKNFEALYDKLPEDALLWPIDEISQIIEDQVAEGKVDAVYVVYTKFKSAISMQVKAEKIMPLEASELDTAEEVQPGSIIFEPSPEEVFSIVVPRIFRTLIRQAALDAKASEHGSRMSAMDSATKNAGELITKLQLKYNKLRQSGITSELLDIIGGAEALN